MRNALYGYAPFLGQVRIARRRPYMSQGSASHASVQSARDVLTKAPQGCRDAAGPASTYSSLISKMDAFLASDAPAMDVTTDETNYVESVKACAAAAASGTPPPAPGGEISPWAWAAGGLILIGTISLLLRKR